MNCNFQLLYNDMLEDLWHNQELPLPEAEIVCSAFWIAHNYWDRLKLKVVVSGFSNDKDEIDFFRNIKPRFTAHIEYFTILSEALVCVPESPAEAVTYWQGEADRFKRFCERHEFFVRYYESGKNYSDSFLFLRRNASSSPPKFPIYDIVPEFCSSHDHLVRGYLAYKMFAEYCHKKLQELNV